MKEWTANWRKENYDKIREYQKNKSNAKYFRYRNKARIEKREFNLSLEQFIGILQKNCHYCGEKSTGIDRKDNNKGYIFENSLPCCGICNGRKYTKKYEDFMLEIRNSVKTVLE